MRGTWISRIFGIAILAGVTAVGLLANPVVGAAQSSREADGARLLKGTLDLHFHMDPWTPGALNGQAGIAEVRVAKARGMRGLVIKDHNEPTAQLAYLLRPEIPGLELYGGFVLNLPNGGINPAGVEFMATKIKGEPGRIVWMPAGDTAKEVRASKNSERALRGGVARRRAAARGESRSLRSSPSTDWCLPPATSCPRRP